MNVENILRVADAIEKHEVKGLGFNMSAWIGDGYADHSKRGCGTTACIGGWVDIVIRKMKPETPAREDWIDSGNALGLDYDQGNKLFFMAEARHPMSGVTSTHAVKVLRHLASTGVVDWDIPEDVEQR